MKEAKILALNISPRMGEPMQAEEKISLAKDSGIEGDRYANGTGAFSKSKRDNVPPELREETGGRSIVRDVSFIAMEAINEASAEFGNNFTFSDTRRNILLEGIPNLTELIGVIFTIGGIAFLGIEACDPCDRPSKLSNKARVLEDGEIQVGDILAITNS